MTTQTEQTNTEESVRQEAKRRNIKMSKVIRERIKKGEFELSLK